MGCEVESPSSPPLPWDVPCQCSWSQVTLRVTVELTPLTLWGPVGAQLRPRMDHYGTA